MSEQQRKWVLVAIFMATFMSSVEITVVTTALPTIIGDLNGIAMQSWVFTAYLLATAITTPIYGKLADQLGRKPVFIAGLVFFTGGSLLCGLAPNMMTLIMARTVQGLGAGAIMPITNTLIADMFSYQQRAKMLAFNNTAWGISALVGPMLGGFLVDQFNWHWIFFINVPLGLVVLILILSFYRETKPANQAGTFVFDLKGSSLLALFLISLLLAFQALGAQRVNWVAESLLLLVCILSAWSFLQVERQVANPIIDLTIFKNQTFSIQILTALLLSGVQFGFQVYFPAWLQAIYHLPAALAGLVVTPGPIMWLVSSFLVGGLLRRFAPKYISMVAIIILMVAYLPLALVAQLPIWYFYLVAGISGAGVGLVITANTVVSQQIVGNQRIGMASSMLTLGRTLGQTILTGSYGLIFNLSVGLQVKHYPQIHLAMLNQFVDGAGHFTSQVQTLLSQMVLQAYHHIYALVIVVLVLAWLVNLRDPQHEIVQ